MKHQISLLFFGFQFDCIVLQWKCYCKFVPGFSLSSEGNRHHDHIICMDTKLFLLASLNNENASRFHPDVAERKEFSKALFSYT